MALIILTVCFFGFLILGVPVAFAIGCRRWPPSSMKGCRWPWCSSR